MRRRWSGSLAVVALAAGAVLAAVGPAASAAATQVSSTEAGYVATGGTGAFSSVAAAWTQPTAHCKTGSQFASFWAGLDGWTSSSVEQIGTDADCSGGKAEYFAWYDMYPAAPVTFSNKISPGDALTASVKYAGGSKFTLKISDSTQGWSHTVTASLAGAARSSAEVFVGTPGTASLTSFGSVNFTGATVNGADLCDASPVKVTAPGLSVSAISACTNFTVTEISPA